MSKRINISKLEYAYDKNKDLVNVELSKKGSLYYLDEDLTIQLLVADGQVNIKHFKRHPSVDYEVIRKYFGNSESIEHLNAKRQILIDGGVSISGTFIDASKVRLEVRFPKTGNIIDAVLYDANDNILLGVEICHTNKKTQEDIEKLNELNINIYEKNTNHRGNRFICVKGERDGVEHRVVNGHKALSRINRQIKDVKETIKQRKQTSLLLGKRLEARNRRNRRLKERIKDAKI